MRRVRTVPKTDLTKLTNEVLSRGCNAALPQNLSDRWLRVLGRDVGKAQKALLEGHEDDLDVDISGPLIIVAAFMARKREVNAKNEGVSHDELLAGLEVFGRAIQEEILGRETGVFLRQYTLDNFI